MASSASDDKPLTFFSPPMPQPPVWDVTARLSLLRERLDPQSRNYYFIKGMHANIRAVIRAYDEGKMPNHGKVYFKGGLMVLEEEGKNLNDFVWKEVRFSNND
jgi:hypothetical protein